MDTFNEPTKKEEIFPLYLLLSACSFLPELSCSSYQYDSYKSVFSLGLSSLLYYVALMYGNVFIPCLLFLSVLLLTCCCCCFVCNKLYISFCAVWNYTFISLWIYSDECGNFSFFFFVWVCVVRFLWNFACALTLEFVLSIFCKYFHVEILCYWVYELVRWDECRVEMEQHW